MHVELTTSQMISSLQPSIRARTNGDSIQGQVLITLKPRPCLDFGGFNNRLTVVSMGTIQTFASKSLHRDLHCDDSDGELTYIGADTCHTLVLLILMASGWTGAHKLHREKQDCIPRQSVSHSWACIAELDIHWIQRYAYMIMLCYQRKSCFRRIHKYTRPSWLLALYVMTLSSSSGWILGTNSQRAQIESLKTILQLFSVIIFASQWYIVSNHVGTCFASQLCTQALVRATCPCPCMHEQGNEPAA